MGKMSSLSQAIPLGPLFYWMLQRDPAAVLEEGDQKYEAPCPLSEAPREELTCWKEQMTR